MQTACTQERFCDGDDHCWHTGSGMDSAAYNADGSGHSHTNYMCCWCGIVKTEDRTWKASDQYEGAHGDHSWANKDHHWWTHAQAHTHTGRG
jgi:hypothetical protein